MAAPPAPPAGAASIRSTAPLRVALQAPPLVRAGVVSLLEAHTARVHVLPPASRDRPDVGLLDLLSRSDRTPPWPHLPVVALVPDDAQVRRTADLMRVTRVLRADAPGEQLVRALEEAYETWPGAHPDVRTDVHPRVVLSPREAEILTLISRGVSNEVITEELRLSLNTVKSHIRSAYRKIGVTTRAQAVIWCYAHGERPQPAAGPVGPDGSDGSSGST